MLVVMHIYVGKVNRYPKDNDSKNIFEIFYGKRKRKKKTFLIAFYIFHGSGKKFLKMVHKQML